jgi:Fur family ferric uptake transcriptional regulator
VSGPSRSVPSDESQRESPRVEAALGRLRSAGERVTPARLAVLRVVDAADVADEHLTAEQIGARVAAHEPAVHRATVYRTLTSLTGTGVLSHVHLGGTATVYHLAHPARAVPANADETGTATHGHAHVQCSSCGRVLDAPAGVLDDVARRLRDDLGFELDTSHAALLGTCAECAQG